MIIERHPVLIELYGQTFLKRHFFRPCLTFSHKRIIAVFRRQPFQFRTSGERAKLARISRTRFDQLVLELINWGFYKETCYATHVTETYVQEYVNYKKTPN